MRMIAPLAAVSMICASAPAHAAPVKSAGAARLQVDTSDLGGVGPVLKERIIERGSQVLRDEGIAAGGVSDPVARITIAEQTGDDPGFAYQIDLVINPTEEGQRWADTCSLCTEAELIAAIAADLEEVAAALRAYAAQRAAAQETAAEKKAVAERASENEDVPASTPEDRSLDAKGKAGIGLLAAGVVAAGAGVGLVLAPARPLSEDPLRETYTQPPGYAVLAVGGAAIVTGAVLLGLGLRDRKRATARRPASYFALQWAPLSRM